MSITLLDGAIGQELVHRAQGQPTGLWSTKVMLESPQLVSQVHDEYFSAGAEIATTNSYAVHRDRLVRYGIEDQFEALHLTSCELAIKSRDRFGSGRVAGSIGPTGWSYRPDLAPPAEQAAELFAEVANLHNQFVDVHLLETMSSINQARGALMGASVTGKPVWLGISVDDLDGTKLRSGESVTDIFTLLDEFEVETLLVNCSLPEAVTQTIPLLSTYGIAIGAYANGFQCINQEFAQPDTSVDHLSPREDLHPDAYAEFVAKWIASGATVVGGCCEIGPTHIRELNKRFKKTSH